MATWYLDPVGGNDASAGTSFATRCLTLAGVQGKAVAAGDTIRVIASPAVQTTGLTGTFVNNTQLSSITNGITTISSPIGGVLNNFNGWMGLTLNNGGNASYEWATNGTVLVGINNGAATSYCYSYDGLNYTAGTFPATVSAGVSGIAYGAGVFVVVSKGTTAYYTSTDGINWTSRTFAISINCVIFNGSLFVAVGPSSTSALSSSNGTTWTTNASSIASNTWVALACAPSGTFVAATATGVTTYSTNGTSWTAGTSTGNTCFRLKYVNNAFFMLPNTAASTIGYSANGTSGWTTQTMSASQAWADITYITGTTNYYVAVAAQVSTIYNLSTNGTTWVAGSGLGPAIASSSYSSCTTFNGYVITGNNNNAGQAWQPDYALPTASTNVTYAGLTTSKKIGAQSTQYTIAAGFTTGQIGYFPCGDGYGFTAVSFKFRQSAGTVIAAGNYTLTLCSDTVGATAVYTVPIPAIKALNQWVTVSYALGSTLSSGGIRSIAINRSSNSGAQTIQIDNVMACYATGSTAITHDTLVASNTSGPFYPIDNFTSTTIGIGLCPASTLINSPGPLESGSSSLYFQKPIILPPANQGTTTTDTTWGLLSKNGSFTSPITISGGWDTSAMSTQSGTTYLSGGNGFGQFMNAPFNVNNYVTSNINLVNWASGFIIAGGCNGYSITANDLCGTTTSGIAINGAGSANQGLIINVNHVHSNNGLGITEGASSTIVNANITVTNIINNIGVGLTINGIDTSNVIVTNCANNYVASASITSVFNSYLKFSNLSYSGKNNSSSAVAYTLSGLYQSKLQIDNTFMIPASTSASFTAAGVYDSDFILGNVTGGGVSTSLNFSSSDLLRLYPVGTYLPANATGQNLNFSTVCNRIVLINTAIPYTASAYALTLMYQNYNGTLGDCRTYAKAGTILTDTSTRHTASGVSWSFAPLASCINFATALKMPIASVYLTSGSTTTVSVWMYRNNTDTIPGLMCIGGQLTGLTSDTYVEGSMAINTWTQYSISLTPTQSGVVKLLMYAYSSNGSTSHTAWFDDISVA